MSGIDIRLSRLFNGKKNLVIACGGGIVLNKINIDRLKEEAVMVYLTASPTVILKRTMGQGRPLLNVNDRATVIRKLLKFREPFYERAADTTIDTSKLDIDAVAEQVIARLKADESHHQ